MMYGILRTANYIFFCYLLKNLLLIYCSRQKRRRENFRTMESLRSLGVKKNTCACGSGFIS